MEPLLRLLVSVGQTFVVHVCLRKRMFELETHLFRLDRKLSELEGKVSDISSNLPGCLDNDVLPLGGPDSNKNVVVEEGKV